MAGKKILLIDDDKSLLTTLGDFLKSEGYEVITASSAEQALKKLEQETPDVIILDISMPGMGGVGFLKEITGRDGKPRYPVLVLTARANMAEFFSGLDVDGFVAKPCEPDVLVAEINRIIMTRQSASESSVISELPRQRKVLVAEDDVAIAAKVCDVFIRAGFGASSVHRGPEVLEKAITQKPDIIVMKRVLTGMNGDAVAGVLSSIPTTRDIPIVLYDDTAPKNSEPKFLSASTMIKKFVRSSNPPEIFDAVVEVLGI